MAKPTTLTASEFDEFIKKHSFAVVDFWSPTCPPCLMLAPVIDELANAHTNVTFAKVNISDPQNSALAQRFGVQVIPTLLIFKGGDFIKRMVGYRDQEQLETELELK